MNWFNKAKTFLTEVRSEVKKVSFPSRKEVVTTTVVVIITSVIFAFFLWVADMGISQGYRALVQVFGS